MANLALVNTSTGEIISQHKSGSTVPLPNGDWVSPATERWYHSSEPYALLPVYPVERVPGKVPFGVTLQYVSDAQCVVQVAEKYVDLPMP